MNYLPGFDAQRKRADETSIDYARRLIDDLYVNNPFPQVVAYSGGKDSTLLLQLACEVSAKRGFKKRLIVEFNDTGVECGDKIRRVKSVFDRLPAPIEPRIVAPRFGLFVYIVGAGYPCPQPMFRYCTTELKIDQSDAFLKSLSAQTGGESFSKACEKKNQPSGKSIWKKTERRNGSF